VCLLHQQGLGVAGDPAGERPGSTDGGVDQGGVEQGGVERGHGHRVRAAHPGREARDRAPQQVPVHVPAGEHRGRADGVLELRERVATRLGEARPQQACGPQLRDRRELLGGGRVAELEQARCGGEVEAGCGEHPQVRDPSGEREPELLRVRGACLVHRQRVHDDRADPRELLRHPQGQRHDGIGRTGAGAGAAAHRVEAERAPQAIGRGRPCAQREQRLRRPELRVRAVGGRVEHHRGAAEVHAVEDGG
jgi:hypothetical protein